MRFTAYRGRGFWVRDGMLELWLAFVVDAIDAAAEPPDDVTRRLRADFHLQATVSFDGLSAVSLDAALPDEASRLRFVALCEAQRVRLETGSWQRSPLAERVGRDRWRRDDTAERLTRIADAFLWIVDGALRQEEVPRPAAYHWPPSVTLGAKTP